MFPLEIKFRNMESSDFIYNDIWDHAERLEKFFPRIVSGVITVSPSHGKSSKNKIYHVDIRLHVPGREILVNRDPEKNGAHEDVYVSIRDAFDAATRQLEDYGRKLRAEVKHHEDAHEEGEVAKIFPKEGYGFVLTRDGREVYFHENALLNGNFGALQIGAKARFNLELGEKGPQVTSMSVL